MAVNIGPRIGIDGEAQFRKEINNIIQQAKALDSEMKLVSSSFDENTDSQEKLEAQSKILNEQLQTQAKRVELLEKGLKESSEQFGESAIETLKWKQAVNEAKTSLNNLQAATKNFSNKSKDSKDAVDKLTDVIQQQETELDSLKRKYANMILEQGKTSSESKQLKKEIEHLSGSLEENRSRLKNAENAAENLGDSFEDAEKSAFDFGDALKANVIAGGIIEGIKGIAGEIGNLAQETQEYRKIMASLDTSSERAGYSAEQTAESYKTLYGVLGDDQTAATTTANLQAIGLEQGKLTELINGTIGAWATYGDSIPIDGLAESVNETIKAGQVTGTFADVLNWASLEGETFGVKLKANTKANEEWNKAVQDASTAEDYFNLALQDAADSTERANLVLKLFSEQGLAEAGEAWQDNNQDIVEANKATADFQETTAELAKKFSPISVTMQKGFNKILDSASNMVDESDIEKFTELLEDGADFIADDVLPVVKDLFDFIIDNKQTVISALTGIGSAVLSWKISGAVTKITNKIKEMAGAVDGAQGSFKNFRTSLKNLSSSTGVISAGIGLLATGISYVVQEIKEESEANKESRKILEEKTEAVKASTDAYNNMADSADTLTQANMYQLENAEKLYAELTQLADESGRVEEKDRSRAQYILGELNKALGTEYDMTGNQIEQYKKMQDEIDDLIEKKKLSTLLENAEKKYKDALENKVKLEEERTEALSALEEQMQKVEDAEQDLENARKHISIGLGNEAARIFLVENAKNDLQIAKDLLKEFQDNYDQAEENVKTAYQNINTYESAYQKALAGNVDGVIAELDELSNSFITASEISGKSAEEQKTILEQQYTDAVNSLKFAREQYSLGTAGFTQDVVNEYENLVTKAREECEKVGVSVDEGYSAGINSQRDSVTNAAQNVTSDILTELEGAKTDAQNSGDSLGASIITGLQIGISSRKNNLISPVKNAMNTVISVANQALGIHSPSKVFKEMGEYTGEGFEHGFQDSMKEASETAKQIYTRFPEPLSLQPFSIFQSSLSPAGSLSSRSVSYGDFSITVVAAPGMDENAIADNVMQKIQTAVKQKEAVFS